jgi:hypothetical protein
MYLMSIGINARADGGTLPRIASWKRIHALDDFPSSDVAQRASVLDEKDGRAGREGYVLRGAGIAGCRALPRRYERGRFAPENGRGTRGAHAVWRASRAGVRIGRRVRARALRKIGALGAGFAITGAMVGEITGNSARSPARRDRVLHGAGDREGGLCGR